MQASQQNVSRLTRTVKQLEVNSISGLEDLKRQNMETEAAYNEVNRDYLKDCIVLNSILFVHLAENHYVGLGNCSFEK